MNELQDIAKVLGWNSTNGQPVELMVLSACRTALGDEQAELGFAGLAVQAGVKSALASLWYVSDAGTLALMNEFYKQLSLTANKVEALRQAQLAMLGGKVKVDQGQLRGSNQEYVALPSQVSLNNVNLSHPYFWSAFTLIGNWN
jgi:CHAT domain-containing protein